MQCIVEYNPNQEDSNGDGLGDECDVCSTAVDGDECDECPGTPSGVVVSPDGCSQGQVDSDGDSVCEGPTYDPKWCEVKPRSSTYLRDNCPGVSNPVGSSGEQPDRDSDGRGDACDSTCLFTDPYTSHK